MTRHIFSHKLDYSEYFISTRKGTNRLVLLSLFPQGILEHENDDVILEEARGKLPTNA